MTLTLLRAWTFEPVLAVGIVLVTGAYLWGVRTVNIRASGGRWPERNTACFAAAMIICWVVLLGPIGAYDDTFFWAHMVQHMALMMLVAPLLLLGAPVLLALRVASRSVRQRWLLPVLRSRLLLALTNPFAGWLIFAGVLVGTHFSPFYNFALEHPLVHDFVEHPIYLGAALIYFYPLLPGNPGPRSVAPAIRVASLFLMMFPETMTGFFIYASQYLIYPYYRTVDRPFGPGPIPDQQLGGALMWAGSMIIDSIWVVLAVLHLLRSEARRAYRIDVRTLGEVPAAP
jgi:cytochrome c oxidase assembly factor CtaG